MAIKHIILLFVETPRKFITAKNTENKEIIFFKVCNCSNKFT
jgi:hypothetical protein